MANTNSVAIQMEKILEQYSKEVKDVTDKSIEKVSKESVQKLKNTSPKRTGKYARSWTKKKVKGRNGIDEVTVHNKQYQLTHLLENGHIVRNSKGTYGRTNGIKHIKPVEEWAQEALPQEIERRLG